MTMSNKLRAALLVCALGAAATVHAQGLRFLHNTPISRFNDADMRLYTAAASQALQAPEPGEPVRWKNEKTGSEGTVTASPGTREGCRRLLVENRHKQLSSKGEHHVCKIDGQWKAEY